MRIAGDDVHCFVLHSKYGTIEGFIRETLRRVRNVHLLYWDNFMHSVAPTKGRQPIEFTSLVIGLQSPIDKLHPRALLACIKNKKEYIYESQ